MSSSNTLLPVQQKRPRDDVEEEEDMEDSHAQHWKHSWNNVEKIELEHLQKKVKLGMQSVETAVQDLKSPLDVQATKTSFVEQRLMRQQYKLHEVVRPAYV